MTNLKRISLRGTRMSRKVRQVFLLFLFFVLVLGLVDFSSALSAVVRVPEKYTDVVAGERLYFEIDVKYPENPKRKDLRLEYEIVSGGGELVAQSKVLKAIETQASFIDFIVIPEGVGTGLYFINVNVKDYEDLSEEVGASFHVRGGKTDQIILYLVIILVVVILIGFLVIFSIVIGGKRYEK